MEKKPLSGIKVVDLSTYVAAPSCCRALADWGADVIKVESLEGDMWRNMGKVLFTTVSDQENPCYDVINANKRCISLDLKSKEGQEVMYKLLGEADIFVTNNRESALKKMGMDYECLKVKYPRLIYALVTGFGEEGPDAANPGFDVAAFWSKSGFLGDVVQPGNYLPTPPPAFGDLTTGLALFGSVCGALYQRTVTNKGDKVSVSLYGTAIWCSSFGVITTQKDAGYKNVFPKTRYNANPLMISYKCSDNEWLLLAILDFNKYYKSFYTAIGVPELADDERFNTRDGMFKNREEFIKILENQFALKTTAEWSKILGSIDVVCDIVGHFKDICKDEQAWANNYLCDFKFDSGNSAALPRPAMYTSAMGLPEYKRSPLLGEHTAEILTNLGYTQEQIKAMAEASIIKEK